MLRLVLFVLALYVPLTALEKLPEIYRVGIGDPKASIKVTEYFSFMCPHCIALFRRDFAAIKEKLIETGKIYFEFHPVPLDMPTVQAMICFEKLNEDEKKLLLEVLLETIDINDSKITPLLMKKAMDLLKKPMTDLEKEDFVTKTMAFQAAFEFVKQEDRIEAIPSIEINGTLYPEEIPDAKFIERKIAELRKE